MLVAGAGSLLVRVLQIAGFSARTETREVIPQREAMLQRGQTLQRALAVANCSRVRRGNGAVGGGTAR